MNDTKVKRAARKAKRWLKDQIVEDVPDSLALWRVRVRQTAVPDGRVGRLQEAAAGRARSSQLESHQFIAGYCACHATSPIDAKWPRRTPPIRRGQLLNFTGGA